MPHTVATLRAMEHAHMAYIVLFDGIPLGFTTDTSGDLIGSGASSYIGRAESDLGETVGGRELREGLIMPDTLEFGSDVDSLGLGRTTARFSVLLDSDTADYFALSGEDPEEMLGRLPPTTDPAPATVVGVTVRSRYLGLEYIGSSGERRMFPFLVGEDLPGYDHHGDTDGALVPATVSERPLVHEGRLVSVYRVYKDPSATSTTNSNAWPSLSNYSPIWVGKMRDAGTFSAGGRVTIECTGFESLLERNMATGASQPFGVTPEFTAEAGVDDQVAIYCGSGPGYNGTNVLGHSTYQGRDWTTLSGDTREEIQSSLESLISDTIAGTSTDYETGESAFDTVQGGDAGMLGPGIYVQRDELGGTPWYHMELRIAMHRRRWLALGFDPDQQDWPGFYPATEDDKNIAFTRLEAGLALEPREGTALMGTIPGPGYYMGVFHTVAIGASGDIAGITDYPKWDNDGSPRIFNPLFTGVDLIRVIRPSGGQVLRMSTDAALLSQSHVPYSGAIDGTDCDAAGYFVIRGKIRRADGSTDDATLEVEKETEQLVVARCSWITRDDYFADPASGTSPALYIEELYDPRDFGYPFRPLNRDWATLDLQATQLHTWATAGPHPEPASLTLSAMMRSTGTSTGPSGGTGAIDQGDNSGSETSWYGDILAAEMGLAIPSSLLPTSTEFDDAFSHLPNGAIGELGRSRPVYEGSFASMDALRALLEPRSVRIGFDGGEFMLYQLRDASPADATVNILESDLYGKLGKPESVRPVQRARALAPVDAWRFTYAFDLEHEERAKDPNAAMRRGDNVKDLNGHGLIAPELYANNPDAAPLGAGWKDEARVLFGQHEARFYARRHGMVTVPVSRPKGQDIYPGTVVTLSNPWVYNADGSQGVSGVVGRVMRAVHHTESGHCVVDILVFEGQYQPPPLYAPMSWIEAVPNSTTLTRATSSDFMGRGSDDGWTQPAWSVAASGNATGVLLRMLPDGTWTEVGTAEVSSVNASTISLATALTAMPPDNARTMIFVLDRVSSQPAWAQEIYSGVGQQGDNSNTRRFV